MSRTNSVGQIIKAFVAVGTLIALACRFGVIKAALDNLCGLTSWTRDAVWPTQIADGLNWLRVLQIGLNFCRIEENLIPSEARTDLHTRPGNPAYTGKKPSHHAQSRPTLRTRVHHL